MAQVQLDQRQTSQGPEQESKGRENGYVMLVAIFLMAALVLGLSIAVPVVRREIQRDRERETIRRGSQYRRAIQLYFRKFHAYPPNVGALEQTDDIRFLRKKYVDPITGKDDWVPIQFGNNKVPTSFGFFGQEIASTSIAGIGPGTPFPGSNQNPNQNQNPTNDSTSFGSDPENPTPPSSGQNTSAIVSNVGIIGFSIPSEKSSIVVYKKQDHYNLWEFVYDPIQDLVANKGAQAANGGNSGTSGSPGGNSPIGSSPGGSLFPPISGAPGPGTWSPNGNLPPVSGGPPNTGPWSPNGNLPSPPEQ